MIKIISRAAAIRLSNNNKLSSKSSSTPQYTLYPNSNKGMTLTNALFEEVEDGGPFGPSVSVPGLDEDVVDRSRPQVPQHVERRRGEGAALGGGRVAVAHRGGRVVGGGGAAD